MRCKVPEVALECFIRDCSCEVRATRKKSDIVSDI